MKWQRLRGRCDAEKIAEPRVVRVKVPCYEPTHAIDTNTLLLQYFKWILTLQKNWDGEGAPPYNSATWQCAVDFAGAVDGPFTQINPGPNRSVVVRWRSACPPFEMLVNFPDDVDELVTWYGDDKDGGHVFAGQMGQELAVHAAPKFKRWIGERS
jgi:hypothetical protein